MPKCKCGNKMKSDVLILGVDLYGFSVFSCNECGMIMKKVPLGDPDGMMFWTVNKFLYLFGIHKKVWWHRDE